MTITTVRASSRIENLAETQLLLLDQVLREECPYVDREALGHWCGLNRRWWLPNSGLSQESYWRLLNQLHANEVPNIALRLARRARIEDLGVMGYALMASSSLEQGLKLAMNLARQSYPHLNVSLAVDRDHAILACEVLPFARHYEQLLLEEWMVSLWAYIQALLPDGVAACASYAMLSYQSPAYHWQYQQILGCRVVFDQTRTVLAIPKQWLYIAIDGHSHQAQALYEGQIKRLMPEAEHSLDFVSRVKRLLLERSAECRFNLESTAPLMALSARTLRRNLANQGTSFRQLSLEVRMELAKDYLLNSQLTAQEVAYQLGYSQPNNFYRAFKRFYGLPPEQFRHQSNTG
jgi:AraC-like DNA-binding protein